MPKQVSCVKDYNMLLLAILLIIAIILFVLIYNKKTSIENFANNDYLYPVQDLQEICKKEYNLKPAYGGELCIENDKPNVFANCKCTDSSGVCKVCYPTEEKYKTGGSVIYNSDVEFES
jgi:hypothetical protein